MTLRELNKDEVCALQVGILDAVALFCEKHQIHYWIDSGTLLGAVRHGGYIPWDDDIDVGMLRPDFIRFMNSFNAENARFQLICREMDENCVYPYGKVLDTHTVLYEPDEQGIKTCVNIDIFIYDNAPDDDAACEKMFQKRDRYNLLNTLRNKMIGTHGFFKDIIKTCGYWGTRPFSRGYFTQKLVTNSERYMDQTTEKVGNFLGYTKFTCSRNVFDSFVPISFEGKEYAAPVGYDQWLTALYGNYMELPPVEKRVSHHMYKAFIEEKAEKILTFGVFDYFHLGHLRLFKQCKEHADYLIVAVQDEAYIRKYKPDAKVLYTTEERVELISALRMVDKIVVYQALDAEILEQTDFDILALGEDHRGDRFDAAEQWCKAHGKRVVRLKRTPGICSSEIKKELEEK